MCVLFLLLKLVARAQHTCKCAKCVCVCFVVGECVKWGRWCVLVCNYSVCRILGTSVCVSVIQRIEVT